MYCEKPHFVRNKGEWLCHQWIGQRYVWGSAPHMQAAWHAYRQNLATKLAGK